ncbi:hypothetical protein [Streptomyces sp. SCSIO ZS0520]|uniref:hypothetical protein n=1 Tax=Streptomyces sp. SCSIO ZS0520 TaxID=2892996 RepID=UPI0021D915D3|nr:hypothetical protein [Streptomyces sp. SCSIO ZS0520]
MTAETTSTVSLTVDIDGQAVCGEVGTITVPVHEGVVEMPDVRRALAALLTEAAASMLAGQSDFALAPPPPGEGESASLD